MEAMGEAKGAKQVFRFSCARRKKLCSTWADLQFRMRCKSRRNSDLIQPSVLKYRLAKKAARTGQTSSQIKQPRASLIQALLKIYRPEPLQSSGRSTPARNNLRQIQDVHSFCIAKLAATVV